MLVMRTSSKKILARGETLAELGKDLKASFPAKQIRTLRVRGNLATWKYGRNGAQMDGRGFIEPEVYSAADIQAVLDSISFEDWKFTFEQSMRGRSAAGEICAVPPASTGLRCKRAYLGAGPTTRMIVQVARELVREILYASMVAPVYRAWEERCSNSFFYRDQAVFGPESNRDTQMEWLGPPVGTWRFDPKQSNAENARSSGPNAKGAATEGIVTVASIADADYRQTTAKATVPSAVQPPFGKEGAVADETTNISRVNSDPKITESFSPPPEIKQWELREYCVQATLAQQHTMLRQDLLDRLEQGADIEPGELSTKIEVEATKSWSFAKLAEVVGTQKAWEIRQHITPTPYRRLLVTDGSGKDVCWKAARESRQQQSAAGAAL